MLAHARAGLAALALFAFFPCGDAFAADVTIPKGTTLEVILDTPLDSDAVAKGHTFQARVLRSLFVEGALAIPRGALVTGEVRHVRTPKDGARSAAIAVKFEDLEVGGRRHDIEGVLTSVMAEQRRKIVEHRGKLTTGRHVDVVLIGTGNEDSLRADTLVGITGEDGEDLTDQWAKAGLGPARVFVGAGTQLALQLDEALTVPARSGSRPAANDRNVHVSAESVRALQAALKSRGLYAGEATGELDEATRSAIALFQIDQGEPIATGDADAETLAALGVRAASR